MFVCIQFPLADLRTFRKGQSEYCLDQPDWRCANPDFDFVRGFGAIRRRRLGGLGGWVDESVCCESPKALRFDSAPTLEFDSKQGSLVLDVKVLFRRFFFDGRVSGKYEVGFYFGSKYPDVPYYHEIDLSAVIGQLFALLVRERNSSKVMRLIDSGGRLASSYIEASTSVGKISQVDPKLVVGGRPLVFVEHGLDENVVVGRPTRKVPEFTGSDFRLSHFDVPNGNGINIPAWQLVSIGRSESEKDSKARRLRICALRLHAEYECLNIVLRMLSRGVVSPEPRSLESDSLQAYLHRALKRISKDRSESEEIADNDEVTTLSFAASEYAFPDRRGAVLDALKRLDVRGNILRNIEREIEVANLHIENISVMTGDNYNISGGQVGHVGPNYGNIYNSWECAEGDRDLTKLKSELEELLEALKKADDSDDKFVAIGALTEAKRAADEGNGGGVMDALKRAGKWTLDFAGSVSKEVAVSAMKASMGLPG